MARKLPGLQRVFAAPSLALVAYGEVGASIYFALGIVALYALGLTPWVLLAVGAVFVVVSLSYAEGASAMPEAGGAATFVRRAFNDPAGFATGWVLLLDYLAVIALAALFVPHYLGTAVGWDAITERPWDIVIGIGAIVVIAAVRLVRRVRLIPLAVVATAIAIAGQLLVATLGLIYLFSADALGQGTDLGSAPTWRNLLFAVTLSALAYTGLETVANLASEAREPGKTLPKSIFAGIGAVVVVYVVIGLVGLSAYPAHPDPSGPGGWSSDLGTEWLRAPLVGIATALEATLPGWAAESLEVFVGVSGALVLLAAVVTAIAGASRLTYSLARKSMLPHVYGRLGRRVAVSPAANVTAAGIACVLLIVAAAIGSEVRFLASLYSFGVFIAFTAAQLAVVRLRIREPDLARPFRIPGSVRIRGRELAVLPLAGATLTFALWIVSLVTHESARIGGPIWLVVGLVVYVATRRAQRESITGRVDVPVGDLVPEEPEGAQERILVPLKMGTIGEEVLASAIRLASERGSTVSVLTVIPVPMRLPLDADLAEAEEAAASSVTDAREVAAEHHVDVACRVVRARSIGEAIVAEAELEQADLILLGSHPRWRRWSRFFSPTVDYVLRHAGCEVMVIAYPEDVLEDEASQ